MPVNWSGSPRGDSLAVRSLTLAMMRLLALTVFGLLPALWLVAAQSPSPSPSASLSVSISLGTSSITETITSRVQNHNTVITTVVPTSFNVSYTVTPSQSASASASASASPAPIILDTRIDPAFGVLGALLILTGLPSAFWGHKNRWWVPIFPMPWFFCSNGLRTSFFLIGFYSLSLVCMVLILKFGVLNAINPPSQTLRGMFVLSCAVAGVAGGAIAVFFWKATRYFIGGWGGQ
jgi:hypothetical protein